MKEAETIEQAQNDTEETPAVQMIASVGKGTTTLMTIGGNEPQPGHNTVSHSVVLTTLRTETGSDRVQVRIKYPSGWKKDKFFQDGDIKEVSKEVAAEFVRLNIATIIEQEKEA